MRIPTNLPPHAVVDELVKQLSYTQVYDVIYNIIAAMFANHGLCDLNKGETDMKSAFLLVTVQLALDSINV